MIDVDNTDKSLRPGMTANVTFVLAQVADAIKIPNAALRFKPTREQMQAIREQFGGGAAGAAARLGRLGRRRRGSRQRRPGAGGRSRRPRRRRAAPAAAGGRRRWAAERDFGDKKPVWKLVDGQPKMVLVKPGLTDGSSTQMLEGDLAAGRPAHHRDQRRARRRRRGGSGAF